MFPYKKETDFNHRQEIDQLKRDICNKFSFILIEIYENTNMEDWFDIINNRIKS